jgi:hypothetical protein
MFLVGDLARLGWRWLMGFCWPQSGVVVDALLPRQDRVTEFLDLSNIRQAHWKLADNARPRISSILDYRRGIIAEGQRQACNEALGVVRLIPSVTACYGFRCRQTRGLVEARM